MPHEMATRKKTGKGRYYSKSFKHLPLSLIYCLSTCNFNWKSSYTQFEGSGRILPY